MTEVYLPHTPPDSAHLWAFHKCETRGPESTGYSDPSVCMFNSSQTGKRITAKLEDACMCQHDKDRTGPLNVALFYNENDF